MNTNLSLRALPLALLLSACSSGGGSGSTPVIPNFNASTFGNPSTLSNPYFGFDADRTATFAVTQGEDLETIVIDLLPMTRNVMGIPCAVVRDRVYEDGLLIEDTHDFYAQDDAGNVWYMGEEVDNYEYDDDGNLLGVNNDSAWEAGLDILGTGTVARPGFAMRANPVVGDYYYQEYYPTIAEDIGRVIALNVPITLADGTSYSCLQIEDTSGIDPSSREYKYFAPGVGFVLETDVASMDQLERVGTFDTGTSALPSFAMASFTNPTQLDATFFPYELEEAHLLTVDTEDGVEVIVIERINTPKTVLGVPCAVIQDRVFLDGLLIEDTHDWFAQDDDGNVWYMGEDVDNYNYDDDGNLLSVDNESAWEAGMDTLGTGSIAQAGYQMLSNPTVGTSYFQEFYEDEAEDMGLVSAVGITVELPDGTEIDNCLRIVDWNPLDPDGLEYKYYAPGVGLVLEEALHEDQVGGLAGVFDTSAVSIPNFGGAAFTMSTLIDNPLFPLPAGATWAYENPTDEGLETITIEVLAMTRLVAGVTCRAVRAREFLDGVIQEDTEDWYAQDDDGNVWYMGEAVINFEYDEDGNALGTNTDGSWEAGADIAGTGMNAQAGYQLPAVPSVGTSFYQEFYEDEAEDLGLVLATDLTLTVLGMTYTNCVQMLDWNPLEPDSLEHKFYAPGIGLVMERSLTDEQVVTLTATSF